MRTLMVLAFFCYFLGMIKYFLHLAVRRKLLFFLATTMIAFGFAIHTAMLFSLSAKTGHGPYTNPFEYTSFFAWTTMGALLTAVLVFRITTLGAFISPLGFLLMAYSFMLPTAEDTSIPVKDFWPTMHFTVSFLALSSFMVVFAASAMYLLQERQLKKHKVGALFKRMPDLDTLDNLFYQALLFGFPLITVGIISGFIWTSSRFHTLMGPNPSRVYPLILVWVIYATLMGGRILLGWRGHQIAVIGVAGFAAAVAALIIHLF